MSTVTGHIDMCLWYVVKQAFSLCSFPFQNLYLQSTYCHKKSDKPQVTMQLNSLLVVT